MLSCAAILGATEARPVAACGRWPTIFVLGAQKAGTTTLSTTLARASTVVKLASSSCCSQAMQTNNVTDDLMCNRFASGHGWPKETHFWSWCLNLVRQSVYRSRMLEQTIWHLQQCSAYPELFSREGSLVAEMTPEYISEPMLPMALAALYPRKLQRSARFIVVLREPVARLFSEFKHFARNGWTDYSTFEAWAGNQLSHYRGHSSPVEAADLVESQRAYRDLARGFYALALQRWRAHWPRRQMLVLNFHELFSKGGEQAARVFLAQFIGFNGLLAPFVHANSDSSSSSQRLGCNTSERLRQVYAPHNVALHAMLAVDESPIGDAPGVEPFFGAFSPAPDCESWGAPTAPTLG